MFSKTHIILWLGINGDFLGGGIVTDNHRLYWLGNEDMSLNRHTIRICGELISHS